jgi:hypothetical protein
MPPGRPLDPASNDGARGMVDTLTKGTEFGLRVSAAAFNPTHASRLLTAGQPPQYRVWVRSRRLVLGALLGILLIAVPTVAEARHWHLHRGRIKSVTLTADGGGSLLAVTFAGRHHHPKLLRTSDPIAAYAIADVDNDGDLDILAASSRDGLLLWRNAGRGRFVLASLPRSRAPADGGLSVRGLTRVNDGPLASDDRNEVAIPRVPATIAVSAIASVFPVAAGRRPSIPSACPSGRAPPRLSV